MDGKRIAIFYETAEGHTLVVAERIRETLAVAGHAARVTRCRAATAADLEGADGFVVGASIHMGKHHARALKFIERHRAALASRPSAFFSVNLSTKSRSPERQADARRYLDELPGLTGWKPDLLASFAGAVPYTRYGFVVRRLMRSINEKDGGDTDTSRDFVYTDWELVEAFALDFERIVG
ncbi:MAG TPA: flavodoxin domain-containing protein [Polyangia bacterium]|nr:flavodoxin domain-containing protein [Polyangia bacterium]